MVTKFFGKYDHIRKLNFQVAIKIKVQRNFRKFLSNLVFLQHISLLFQKNCNFSKIKFLVGLRKFFEILTSQIRHCDVHRGLRQISTGLRQPDLRQKCDFSRCSATFKVNMAVTCQRCQGTCKNLQNSVDILE